MGYIDWPNKVLVTRLSGYVMKTLFHSKHKKSSLNLLEDKPFWFYYFD